MTTLTEVKQPVYVVDETRIDNVPGRYRALRTNSDELRAKQRNNADNHHRTHRMSLMFVCGLGAAILMLALALQIAGLSLPYWMILPNIPGNNPNLELVNIQQTSNINNNNNLYYPYTSTYYSGMWMFCGWTADNDVFLNNHFCMPAEIYNPSTPTLVIKFNGFVGYWRLTTRGLALAAAVLTLVAMIGACMAIIAGCSGGAMRIAALAVWGGGGLLALILTCACVIYFIVSFQLDATKMFYNAGGTTIYERSPYISFYLYVASIGIHVLGLIFTGAAGALGLIGGNNTRL